VSKVDYEDISTRFHLKHKLQCNPFSWNLENIYSDSHVLHHNFLLGKVQTMLKCYHIKGNQFEEHSPMKLTLWKVNSSEVLDRDMEQSGQVPNEREGSGSQPSRSAGSDVCDPNRPQINQLHFKLNRVIVLSWLQLRFGNLVGQTPRKCRLCTLGTEAAPEHMSSQRSTPQKDWGQPRPRPPLAGDPHAPRSRELAAESWLRCDAGTPEVSMRVYWRGVNPASPDLRWPRRPQQNSDRRSPAREHSPTASRPPSRGSCTPVLLNRRLLWPKLSRTHWPRRAPQGSLGPSRPPRLSSRLKLRGSPLQNLIHSSVRPPAEPLAQGEGRGHSD
ncbi:Polypeptide N-acetylgalactosaminyltransferase 1, partial [Galemys pyrenaicus]